MIKTPVVVKTEEDFDGRPIALLVQEASQYASTIYIQVGEKHINAKSIMGMMSLSLADGEEITVVTDGEDEQRAAEGINNIFFILRHRPYTLLFPSREKRGLHTDVQPSSFYSFYPSTLFSAFCKKCFYL